MQVFKRRGGVLTFSFSLALIASICLAANLLASNGSTIITTFFDLPLLGDTYKIKNEEMIMLCGHTMYKSNETERAIRILHYISVKT